MVAAGEDERFVRYFFSFYGREIPVRLEFEIIINDDEI